MKKSLILFIMMFSCYIANAQRLIHGIVYELGTNGKETPLVGANVVWINKQTGVSTNSKGEFLIKADGITDQRLVVSFIGLQSDTVLVKPDQVKSSVWREIPSNCNSHFLRHKPPA